MDILHLYNLPDYGHDLYEIFRALEEGGPGIEALWGKKRKPKKKTSYVVDDALFTQILCMGKKRGIDLNVKAKDVQRIFYAKFGKQCVAEGLEPDDVLQEIYRSLLIRNAGSNPFDESRCSAGHYIFMVCQSVFVNYRQKMFRVRNHECKIVTEDDSEFDFPTPAYQEVDADLSIARKMVDGGATKERLQSLFS